MYNPIASPAEPPSRRSGRRPSLKRVFFLVIPVAALLGWIALLIASSQLDAVVQTYQKAGPCPSASAATACYTLVPGTLTKFSISRGKSGDTTDMTLQLPDGTRSTWAKTSWQQEDALHVGAPVQAKFYLGALTTVYVGSSVGIQTKDNPIYKQTDMRLAVIGIPILGLIIATVSFTTIRTRKQIKLGPMPTIDATLPVEEQQRLLRQALWGVQPGDTPSVTAGSQATGVTLPFTLRPHPIPTGRPWWVSLIMAGIALPLLLLRMRTPGSIARVVLGVTGCALLAAVVLHWLYRNRRMLVVDDLTVRRVNLFGISHVVSRNDIARVACPIVMNFGMTGPEPRLLLLDASGRCLLGLKRYYPTDEEAALVAAALRVPQDTTWPARLTTLSRLRRTIPGAVSWPEAHPYVTALVLVPPIFVAACLLVWTLNGFK